MYFLDFDRTLFNYEAFRAYFVDLPQMDQFRPRIQSLTGVSTPEAKEGRKKLWGEIDRWYASGGYEFKKEELARFLYDDALAFLEKHGSQVVIVTSGGEEIHYQKDKVASSGALALVKDAKFLPGRDLSKGYVVKELVREHRGNHTFIDDLPWQLDEVKREAPEVSVIEMRRDRAPGCGRYPVIHSFEDSDV